MTENFKRFLGTFEALGYSSLVVFNGAGILHFVGEPIEWDEIKDLYHLKENRAVQGFSMAARLSFHHDYAILWRRPSFDEQCSTHLKLLNLYLENEYLRRQEALYYQMIREIGEITDAGIVIMDESGELNYENDAARHMEILKSITSQEVQLASLPTEYVEMLAEYPAFKAFGKRLSGGGSIIQVQRASVETETGKGESRQNKLRHSIIGNDPQILEVMTTIDKIAGTDSTVLIRGESGTGKERFARLIHEKSLRSRQPFIAINCASIPENLLESELFGYAKGSFTGALKGGKTGKFELANNGTLFLDEIGDMSLSLQAKLLRVLQEKVIEKVGGNHPIKVDVRIISATHQNLEDMIKQVRFRKDLFYRLNVIPIHIPPLHERVEDIDYLVHYYIKKYCIVNNRPFMVPSAQALDQLKRYAWPGNIRELINVIEYIVSIEDTQLITCEMLPREITHHHEEEKSIPIAVKTERDIKSRKPNREELISLLDEYGYSSDNKRRLAAHLNVSLATLYRWLKKYKIS